MIYDSSRIFPLNYKNPNVSDDCLQQLQVKAAPTLLVQTVDVKAIQRQNKNEVKKVSRTSNPIATKNSKRGSEYKPVVVPTVAMASKKSKISAVTTDEIKDADQSRIDEIASLKLQVQSLTAQILNQSSMSGLQPQQENSNNAFAPPNKNSYQQMFPTQTLQQQPNALHYGAPGCNSAYNDDDACILQFYIQTTAEQPGSTATTAKSLILKKMLLLSISWLVVYLYTTAVCGYFFVLFVILID